MNSPSLTETSCHLRWVCCTVPNAIAAEQIAHALINAKLAACVSVSPPALAIYHWQGKIETAQEYTLIIKTTADSYEAVEKKILNLHPYEVPEIIAFPVIDGFKPFIEWITTSMGKHR